MPITNRFRAFAPPAQLTERESTFGGGFLLLAALTVALGVGIGVAGYLWHSPKPSDAVSDAVASATAPRETPMALAPLPELDDGSWTDADLHRCSEEAAAAADAASKRKLAAVSADRVGLGAPDPKMVERSAYLLCSIANKPGHLCKSYWHDKLVDAIRLYASDFHNVSKSAYWTKVSLAERTRVDVGNKDLRVMADDIDQTTRDVMKMNDEIVTALRALVANGIVQKSEFGRFLGLGVPPDIATMLGDGPAVRHVCG